MSEAFLYLKKLREIKKQRKQLKKLIKKQEKENKKKEKQIKKSLTKIKQENYIKALKNMDVETLNFDKSGIKINTLKQNGIKNVYQVSKMSVKKLEALNGIGEKNARLIYKNAKIIRKKLKENTSISINADDKTQRNLKLVNDTYTLDKNNKDVAKLKSLVKQNENTYKVLERDANKLSNPFVFMFASEEKKQQIYNSIDELENWSNENYTGKT
ncbi:MAG: hypothetical protein MJ245_04985, partial [Clostridia bacterium]|nr:hypothetical protein [Clostridia bacterium]